VTLEELETTWAVLRAPAVAGAITGRRAPGLPADRPVYLAVDSRRNRHLLVEVPEGTAPVAERETRSLEVTTARFQVGGNPEALYVDLACTDASQHATFAAISQDLLRACRQSSAPARDEILAALGRWRAFWSTKAAPLGREEALGLFGELWFMRRWIGVTERVHWRGWQVTDRARHDFQWPQLSVEVKAAATQSGSAPIHHIASLDQLADPEQGVLYLFSLQVCDDALAVNSLRQLVNAIVADLASDPQALDSFKAKLIARGYSDEERQHSTRPLRVVAERLYKVDGAFPRVVRASFGSGGAPNGIVGLKYELDLTACEQWLLATRPDEIQLKF